MRKVSWEKSRGKVTERTRLAWFAAAFVLGALFLMFGIYRGEVAVVLKKAIYICLECIGIG